MTRFCDFHYNLLAKEIEIENDCKPSQCDCKCKCNEQQKCDKNSSPRPMTRSSFKDPLKLCSSNEGSCTCYYWRKKLEKDEQEEARCREMNSISNGCPMCMNSNGCCQDSSPPNEHKCSEKLCDKRRTDECCGMSEERSNFSVSKNDGKVVINLNFSLTPEVANILREFK